MRITVDADRCISSGQCVMNAGKVFDQSDDDGVVILLSEHPETDQADDARRAAAACPGLAITIEE